MSPSLRIHVNEQVSLSELRDADQPVFVKFLNDEEIYRCTLRIPRPYTLEDARHFLELDAVTAEKHGHPVNFAIRDDHDALIGGCGFEGLVYGHRAEIGYWLARPYWGRGIMTEVVRAACEFAMSHWDLVRITAHVFAFNHASARVLEKAGFQLEGLLRKYHSKDGAYLDSKVYGQLRDECESVRIRSECPPRQPDRRD